MDPITILELTGTVLALSQKLYKFFKAIHDAPEEIRDYLSALETTRRVFVDIQEYVEMYQMSAFAVEDGMRLRVIEPALKDCELEFSLQLSYVESLQPEQRSSLFVRSKKQGQWVLNKDTIEGLTKKLEKLQRVLSLAVTTSTGKDAVLLREKLEVVSSEMCKVSKSHETEVAERQTFLLGLQQYGSQIQRGISLLLHIAQEVNSRSDAGLDHVANSLTEDNRMPTSADRRERDENVQNNVSLVQVPGAKRDLDKLHTVDGQPVAMQEIESARRVSRPMSQESAESVGCHSVMKPDFKTYRSKEDLLMMVITGGFVKEDLQISAQLSTPLFGKVASTIVLSKSTIVLSNDSCTRITINWRCMRWLLSDSMKNAPMAKSMMESLLEMSDTIQTCERELVLYKDAKIQNLVSRLYTELFEVLQTFRRLYLRSRDTVLESDLTRTNIEKPMAKMRRLYQAVMREVDYRHRVELRETVTDIQIEQRKILTTLEDQRRILKSLQEERRIVGVVQEQQKILQIVQQIQGAMQLRGTSEEAGS